MNYNRPVHFEVRAEDPERAIKFYMEVFGWKFQKWDGPMEYWMITTGDPAQPGINGGLGRRPGPRPAADQPENCFPCTMGVENCDAMVAAIAKAGGAIVMPKMPIPTVGWLAYARDPEGNLFGVMQNDPQAK